MPGDRIPTWNDVPIPYHESVEALRTQIRASGSKAGAAIFALARKAEPEALAILVDLTRSPDPHLRRAALEGIGEHSLGREAAETVLGLLEDSHGFVVRTACDVSAVLGLSAAHDQILGLVDANDTATQASALRALQTLWMPSDFENVFARYLKDRSVDVRKQAAWTLNKNVGPEHWQRLFEVWAKDGLARHRVWACSLAEKFGDRTVLAELHALCSDPDGHVRTAGERAAQVVAEE